MSLASLPSDAKIGRTCRRPGAKDVHVVMNDMLTPLSIARHPHVPQDDMSMSSISASEH